jgi:hypothetical protein
MIPLVLGQKTVIPAGDFGLYEGGGNFNILVQGASPSVWLTYSNSADDLETAPEEVNRVFATSVLFPGQKLKVYAPIDADSTVCLTSG